MRSHGAPTCALWYGRCASVGTSHPSGAMNRQGRFAAAMLLGLLVCGAVWRALPPSHASRRGASPLPRPPAKLLTPSCGEVDAAFDHASSRRETNGGEIHVSTAWPSTPGGGCGVDAPALAVNNGEAAGPVVAVAVAVTSRTLTVADVSATAAEKRLPAAVEAAKASPLMSVLLPSLVRTLAEDLAKAAVAQRHGDTDTAARLTRHRYILYVAFDAGDAFFDCRACRGLIESLIAENIANMSAGVALPLRWVRCPYTGFPAWSQDAAGTVAFMNGADFVFRVNDDSELVTSGWAAAFEDALRSMRPPLLGVVGPVCHQGNTGILTHDFVHRTHTELFGWYYPQEFPAWFADEWISNVYGRYRTVRPASVVVQHALVKARYHISLEGGLGMSSLLRKGREIVAATILESTRANAAASGLEMREWCHLQGTPLMTLKVLTRDRPASLLRLLQSLERADYGDSTGCVDLDIWVDALETLPRHSEGHMRSGERLALEERRKKVLQTAESWTWRQGVKRVKLQRTRQGLMGQWLTCWGDVDEHVPTYALVLEDDLEVSPHFHKWLMRAIAAYFGHEDVAGVSLQRQVLVADRTRASHPPPVDQTNQPYLYRLLGTWGFAPNPTVWRQFLQYARDALSRNVDPTDADSVRHLIPSKWFADLKAQGRADSMWSIYFIRFVADNDLFTVYPAPPGGSALVANWQESGEHFDGEAQRDATLSIEWSSELAFVPPLSRVARFGWDGGVEPPPGLANTLAAAASLASPEASLAAHPPLSRGMVIVSQVNAGYLDFALNWACSLSALGVHNVLFYASDDVSATELRRRGYLVCALTEGGGISYGSDADSLGSAGVKYGTVAYQSLILARTRFVQWSIDLQFTILVADVDAVWIKRPWQWFISNDPANGRGLYTQSTILSDDAGEADIVGQAEEKEGMLCGGFLLLRPTSRTRSMWRTVTLQHAEMVASARKHGALRSMDDSEQVLLADAIAAARSRVGAERLRVRALPREAFPSGDAYFVRHTDQQDMAIVVHNNYVIGKASKKERFAKSSLWFLAPNMNNCSTTKGLSSVAHGTPFASNAPSSVIVESLTEHERDNAISRRFVDLAASDTKSLAAACVTSGLSPWEALVERRAQSIGVDAVRKVAACSQEFIARSAKNSSFTNANACDGLLTARLDPVAAEVAIEHARSAARQVKAGAVVLELGTSGLSQALLQAVGSHGRVVTLPWTWERTPSGREPYCTDPANNFGGSVSRSHARHACVEEFAAMLRNSRINVHGTSSVPSHRWATCGLPGLGRSTPMAATLNPGAHDGVHDLMANDKLLYAGAKDERLAGIFPDRCGALEYLSHRSGALPPSTRMTSFHVIVIHGHISHVEVAVGDIALGKIPASQAGALVVASAFGHESESETGQGTVAERLSVAAPMAWAPVPLGDVNSPDELRSSELTTRVWLTRGSASAECNKQVRPLGANADPAAVDPLLGTHRFKTSFSWILVASAVAFVLFFRLVWFRLPQRARQVVSNRAACLYQIFQAQELLLCERTRCTIARSDRLDKET